VKFQGGANPSTAAAPPGAGLTDAELRALPVPVSGPLTLAQLVGIVVAVSGNVSVLNAIDVVDRAARALGVISGAVAITNFPATQPVSIAAAIDVLDRAGRLLGVADVSDRAARALGVVASITAAVDVSDRVARALGVLSDVRAADLLQGNTAAVNTALTITLPAVAAKFHYITSIQILKRYSVIGVAAGAGIIITTTNLNGLAWDSEQLAAPAGTVVKVVDLLPATPIRSAVVNTATTVVMPQQLQTIWRANVSYFTAA
jgi:hypothetical protein